MTTLLERSQDQNREMFLERLVEAQSLLAGQGVEYRIIGSLATSAYVDPPGTSSIDFNRPHAFSADQRVPDIDLIVARSDLDVCRHIRDRLLTGKLPVKLGLAIPSSEIDFRPDDDVSYLTHRTSGIAIGNETLKAVQRELLSVPIITTDPRTLLHTYVTFGGKLRHKDIPKVRSLTRLVSQDAAISDHLESEYLAFHDFIHQRQATPTLVDKAGRLLESVSHKYPRSETIVEGIRCCARPVAKMLGIR